MHRFRQQPGNQLVMRKADSRCKTADTKAQFRPFRRLKQPELQINMDESTKRQPRYQPLQRSYKISNTGKSSMATFINE